MADDDPEVLDLGVVDPSPAPSGADDTAPSSRVSRRGVFALAGLAAAGGLGLVVRDRGTPPVQAQPQPSPTQTASAGPSPASDASAPLVTELGGPLLDGPRVEVFALVAGAIVRIQLAVGRMTRTPLPHLPEDTVSVVPIRRGVLVHCGHFGPVYVVGDGQVPRPAPSGLAGTGPMLPGPDLDHVWVLRNPGSGPYLALLELSGRPTGTAVPLPLRATAPPVPDAAGSSVVSGVGGTYWAGPQGLRRVTTGVAVASGPTGWVAVECDDGGACSGVLVNRNGSRRPVAGVLEPTLPAGDLDAPSGAVSPDGRSAALFVDDRGRVRLVVLDLVTGRRTRTSLVVDRSAPSATPAWTPTGRHVLALDAAARIVAADARTGDVRPLVPDAAGVMPVGQFALRTCGDASSSRRSAVP